MPEDVAVWPKPDTAIMLMGRTEDRSNGNRGGQQQQTRIVVAEEDNGGGWWRTVVEGGRG